MLRQRCVFLCTKKPPVFRLALDLSRTKSAGLIETKQTFSNVLPVPSDLQTTEDRFLMVFAYIRCILLVDRFDLAGFNKLEGFGGGGGGGGSAPPMQLILGVGLLRSCFDLAYPRMGGRRGCCQSNAVVGARNNPGMQNSFQGRCSSV